LNTVHIFNQRNGFPKSEFTSKSREVKTAVKTGVKNGNKNQSIKREEADKVNTWKKPRNYLFSREFRPEKQDNKKTKEKQKKNKRAEP